MPKGDAPGQLLFDFAMGEAKPQEANSVILFHLPRAAKETFARIARKQGLSLTRLLNDLIGGYITAQTPPEPKKKTGRGNVDIVQAEKAKELFRSKHPQGVRQKDVANYVGCSISRAARLIDRFSGRTDGRGCDFTVYEDDFVKPTLFYISKDTEATGNDKRPADWAYKVEGDNDGKTATRIKTRMDC